MQAGKFVSANDIQDEQTGEYFYPCYGGNGLRGYVKKYNNDGDFTLVGRQGALCGNVQIVSGKFYATEHAVVTDGYGQTNVKWAFYFLTALNLNQYATATAQPGLAVSNILEVLLPLPPLSEQHRIVEKLEGLLPLIEQYDVAQSQLDTLNDELKGLLKKSILQEAIRGKLVPQCDTDEPASMLLEHIKDEKRKLVRAGKLKAKDIVDSVIFKGEDNKYYEKCGEDLTCIDKEIPFEIPTSWLWCRLQSLVAILDGYRKPISKEARKHGEYPYYGANGILDYVNDYIFDGEYLLVGEDGSVVSPNGNPIVNKVSGKIWVNNHAHVLQEYGKLGYYEYLFYALSTIKITQYIHGFMPKYSQGDLRKTLIPVPPLAEQQRILLKIAQALASIMSR